MIIMLRFFYNNKEILNLFTKLQEEKSFRKIKELKHRVAISSIVIKLKYQGILIITDDSRASLNLTSYLPF